MVVAQGPWTSGPCHAGTDLVSCLSGSMALADGPLTDDVGGPWNKPQPLREGFLDDSPVSEQGLFRTLHKIRARYKRRASSPPRLATEGVVMLTLPDAIGCRTHALGDAVQQTSLAQGLVAAGGRRPVGSVYLITDRFCRTASASAQISRITCCAGRMDLTRPTP